MSREVVESKRNHSFERTPRIPFRVRQLIHLPRKVSSVPYQKAQSTSVVFDSCALFSPRHFRSSISVVHLQDTAREILTNPQSLLTNVVTENNLLVRWGKDHSSGCAGSQSARAGWVQAVQRDSTRFDSLALALHWPEETLGCLCNDS